jgi:hypothetical protein
MACLQQYTYMRMGNSDIKRLITKGVGECFSSDQRERDRQARNCLPLAVGTDREGRSLEAVYVCDHACPGDGQIWVRYQAEPGLEGCCERGGLTIRSWTARGAYMDCGPPEYFDALAGMPNFDDYSLCDDR